MSNLPVVAIVGRPNVGKSSLFNTIVGRRISIVDPTAGVTRDRVISLVKAGDHFFELVDTGGMGIEDCDNLTAEIERQINIALNQADVILFVLDVRDGLMPLDHHVVERLRAIQKPILCVANKCDTPELDVHAMEFYSLGFDHVHCVSADQRRGRKELIGAIVQALPETPAERPNPEIELQLAIVGRRNVGKSTFINSLAEADRVIVSEVAGTTRDSIDVRFERDGKSFIAIDTAGVRRKKSLASDVEFYSMARAERSIRRSDVVLHFFDPRVRVSKVDKQLTDYILEHHKPAIFVVNKWDLVADKMVTSTYADYIRKMFPMLDYVPIVFITAKEGRNVYKLLNMAQNLFKQASKRVKTGELNRVLRDAIATNPPPMRANRQPKIFFGSQVSVAPPTMVLFTNGPELIDAPYQRYILNAFRDHLPFTEVPIKLYLRAKSSDGGKSDSVPDMNDMPVESKNSSDTPLPGSLRRSDAEFDAPAVEVKKEPKPEKKLKVKPKRQSTTELWDI